MPTKDSNSSDEEGSSPAEDLFDGFAQQIADELADSETELKLFDSASSATQTESSLKTARELVAEFRPTPQLIWRIANFTMGRAGRTNKLSDGNLFGLKKLVLSIGKDRVLGQDSPVLTTRSVLDSVPSDVIAAVAVVHGLGRRLQTKQFQAVWAPILDDALLRAQIGYFVGMMCEDFGPGRGMLAGFAGRIGLAVLIATGTPQQAQSAVTSLAAGEQIEGVAINLYGCEPLHLAAMILSAAGCGRESVVGIASYSMHQREKDKLSPAQKYWLAALTITEKARAGRVEEVPEEFWTLMRYEVVAERKELAGLVDSFKNKGHGWSWMI